MADLDPESFPELLAGAREGERAAWERLYREFAGGVLGYLQSQRIEHAEDVLAEVWLQVVRDLERFTGDALAFRSWILRIAHNRLIDARRSSARRRDEVPVANVPDQADVEPELPRLDQAELEQLFAGLPPTQRAVLYLRFVLDLPQGEIAEILGLSLGAVKMQQRRGIDSVAARIDEGVGE